MVPYNPFVVGKYISPEYFCDRKSETELLWKHIINGRNIALIAPRRLGKTGLIQHFFRQENVSQEYYTIFVDFYATTSLTEMVYLLGKSIYDTLRPTHNKWVDSFFQTISSLRAGFKLDPITGEPTFDIGLGQIESANITLDEIFAYLEQADKPCIVAIDEFQQISEYEEKNVEALLRTKIQHSKNCQFIFCGSKRHMMTQMFNSASKPFYQSAITMGLDPIPQDVYADFAANLFERRNKIIERQVIEKVYNMFNGYTWYIQMILNELFALTPTKEICSEDMIQVALSNVIASQDYQYKEIMQQIPAKQKLLLQAISKEGTATNVTSGTFIKKYNLNSASSVQSALKALLEKDIITQNDKGYQVYDRFFAIWLSLF